MAMTFVETAIFTRRVVRLGLEDALRRLEAELADRPNAGDLEPGTGGLRKIRMPDPRRGKGKRGGARVYYLVVPQGQRIYLVFVYGKDEAEMLTGGQRRLVAAVVSQIKAEPRT
jgi:hypothetical protein